MNVADRIEAAALSHLPWYIILDHASREAVDFASGDQLWKLVFHVSSVRARTFLLIVANSLREPQ